MCALRNRIHHEIYRHPKPISRFCGFLVVPIDYHNAGAVSKNLKIRVTIIILIAEPLFIMGIKNNSNQVTVSMSRSTLKSTASGK